MPSKSSTQALVQQWQKRQQRQALSLPVLDEFKAWLEKNSLRVVKDSLTWKAIRPFAVGRRWLFADTPRGARACATVYSLIETAKAN